MSTAAGFQSDTRVGLQWLHEALKSQVPLGNPKKKVAFVTRCDPDA